VRWNAGVLSRSWLEARGGVVFVIPGGASVIAVVGAIALTRQPVSWPGRSSRHR